MKNIFEGKDIMVTGGCGSIGSEIIRQLLKANAAKIRIFDHNESGHNRLAHEFKSDKLRHLIGDVRDRDRVMRAMEGVDIVFHAGALKHVHFCEYNPFEAVSTNVIGTQNLVDAAQINNVKIFVGISTDKAANPISTMGATKLLGEKIITSVPGETKCIFCCVRFGNVLNSDGSVIPLFTEQIKTGGPVTLTSKDMTRFFMSITDAVQLTLNAAQRAKGGEIFILKMNALRIIDLAEALIEELAPRFGKDPGKIKIVFTGVRPGEKIDEVLLTPEESDYVIPTDNMMILYNSLLSNYGKDILSKTRTRIPVTEYNSGKVKLLTKSEIKKLLIDKKII